MKPTLIFASTLVIAALAVSSASAQARGAARNVFLRDGDRVVFYGDSITAQRYYNRDVEEFFLTRYPSLKVDFYCAGVSGDTVYGGYAGDTDQRLARDVFPLKPTVVTIMLGMNDPGYVPFDPHIFDMFKTGYGTLLAKMTSGLTQARFTLIASSPYDELTHGTDFPGLSGTVEKYGMYVQQLASEKQYEFANYNSALDAALRSAVNDNSSYAALLIPDRIHPSEQAHWIMAEELLRAWNASPEVSRVEIDAGNGSVMAVRNAEITDIKATEKGVSWTALERALPLPFSTDDPMMNFAVRVGKLETLDQEVLLVRGLTANQYSLQIDDKPVLDLTRDQLSAGVNLALLPTPMLDQARGLDWLEDRKLKMDAARFALEGEMPATPGAADAAKVLRAAEDALSKQQRDEAQPKPHKFALLAK